MNCFRFQVNYLYGKITLTYLKLILCMVTEQALGEILCQPKDPISPHYKQPYPSWYGSITLTFERELYCSMVKITITSFKKQSPYAWQV